MWRLKHVIAFRFNICEKESGGFVGAQLRWAITAAQSNRPSRGRAALLAESPCGSPALLGDYRRAALTAHRAEICAPTTGRPSGRQVSLRARDMGQCHRSSSVVSVTFPALAALMAASIFAFGRGTCMG